MTLPHVAKVNRMSESNGKYVYGYVHNQKCFLQPLDAQLATLYGVTVGKASVVYANMSADIQESDRLEINGTTFGVKAVTKRDYGNLRHKRMIVEEV